MIDFTVVAERFRRPLTRQTALMLPVFDRLASSVELLVRQASVAETATRGYPMLRYRDGAVGVRLHLGSGVVLPTAVTPLGIADGLRTGGVTFMAGLGLTGITVEQDLALPRLAGVLIEMLGGIEASLGRHLHAEPGMFDPRRVRFSDIFGLANLGWSGLIGSANQPQLRAAAQGGLAARDLAMVLGIIGSSGSAPRGVTAPDSHSQAPPDGPLDGIAPLISDALLLIPLVPSVVDVLLSDAILATQRRLLTELSTQIEPHLRELRNGVVDAWSDAFDLATTVHFAIAATNLVVQIDALLLTSGFPVWFAELVAGVTDFANGLTAWGTWTSAMLTVVQLASEDLMDVDLLPWLAGNLLPGWLADQVPLPSVTIGDIVELAAGQGDPDLRARLHDALDRLSTVAHYTPFTGNLDERLAAARDIGDLILSPTPFTYPPDVLPTTPLNAFPNVYEAIFGGGRRAALTDTVRRLGVDAHGSILDTLRVGQQLADGAVALSATEGLRQGRVGAALRLPERELAERGIVESLFAPLRDDTETRDADPLAVAFEGAVSIGGIATAATAIPAYIGQLRDYWTVRRDPRNHPTSAHILARRGRFAGVRVPRLVVGAAGWRADEPLAVVVATRFRSAVADAYREGLARMTAEQSEASISDARPGPGGAHHGGGRRGR